MNIDFRTQMMTLWHKIFGDSYDYIRMLFDAYYDKSYIDGCMDEDGNLISSMMAIPYTIACSKYKYDAVASVINSDIFSMRANYLCGLATDEKFRKRGIMTEMIRKCNKSLFENNYAISFLIPSGDSTRKYYKKFGYVDVTFNYEYFYDNGIDFYSVDKSIFEFDLYNNGIFKRLKTDIDNILNCSFKSWPYKSLFHSIYSEIINDNQSLKSLIYCFKEYYSSFVKLRNFNHGAMVFHSFNDFITILTENFINDGEVLLLKDAENKPLGMIFCSKYIQDEVVVQLLISKSEEIDKVLLETLKSILPASTRIRVRNFPTCNARCENAIHPSSASELRSHSLLGTDHRNAKLGTTENFGEKPYAMVKILNVAEVLKFVSSVYPASEFSILIKEDEFEENKGLYMVKEGKVTRRAIDSLAGSVAFEDMQPMAFGQDHLMSPADTDRGSYYEMTVPQLASVIWSHACPSAQLKRGQIPELPVSVALMLD